MLKSNTTKNKGIFFSSFSFSPLTSQLNGKYGGQNCPTKDGLLISLCLILD